MLGKLAPYCPVFMRQIMNEFGKKGFSIQVLSSLGELSKRPNEFLHWGATGFNVKYRYPEEHAITHRFSHFNTKCNCKEREASN